MSSSAGAVVSVVAPVYNEAATLTEFVERLVRTTRGLEPRYQFEFVLVDDGSTDGSLTLASECAGFCATRDAVTLASRNAARKELLRMGSGPETAGIAPYAGTGF